jgi:hypothetical protein
MIVHPVSGGWALFSHWADDDDVLVRVRFAVREDGRLEPAEVHLEGRPNLTGSTLRNVPLGSIEAWGNGRGREALIESIADTGAKVDKETDRWLRTVGGGERELMVQVSSPLRRGPLRLRVPDGPKRPDAFYAKVAKMYSALTASGSHRPAAEIAEANGIPVTTVRRWIKEARRRKLLPRGSKGKAG